MESVIKKGEEKQLVTFKIGEEEFGVNVTQVREIIRMETITKIPNATSHIKGVINLRGGIIVVVDLAEKLGLQHHVTDSNTRIIVIEVTGNTVGMMVDSATEVLHLSSEHVKPAPQAVIERIDAQYIEGVGILNERLLILLDLSKIFEPHDLEHVKAITSENKT